MKWAANTGEICEPFPGARSIIDWQNQILQVG